MRTRRAACALVTLLAVPACGAVNNDPIDSGTVDAPVDAAIDAAVGMCDPAVSAAPIADSCGVFVDPTGGDDANVPSSKASPMATLAAALAQVPSGGAVYACSGAALVGGVTVPAGVRLYGGLACGTWIYDPQQATVISAIPDVIPLRLGSGAATTVLSDLYVQAASASDSGGSSIAIVADGATASLRRVLIVTGDARPGDPGDPPVGQGTAGTRGNNGAGGCTGISIPGGPAVTLTCSTGASTGGKGGDGAYYGYDGDNGTPGPANFGLGMHMSTSGCLNGRVGAVGDVGGTGMPGMGKGAIRANGYTGVAGDVGGVGTHGQGGGGGGGSSSFGNCPAGSVLGGGSGGAGGTGGCGGSGGTGGQPGGASIGIISLDASLIFAEVTIRTGTGGAGGPGGDGQAGGPGGDPGTAGSFPYNACGGGRGGVGGVGGIGGGGTGGHSIGIAYTGVAPASAMVTFMLGTAGAGGGTGPAAGEPGIATNSEAF
ncbi:MAG: hypothetical protein IPL61_27275 [Myxococcales bacterium]|nr:hypothetical protein [Myxococcales bacterium]